MCFFLFPPRAALALPLTSANVVKSLPCLFLEPLTTFNFSIVRQETLMRFARHGAAFSSPDSPRAPLICAVLPRHRPLGPHLPVRDPHPAAAAPASLRARRAVFMPPACPVPQFPQSDSIWLHCPAQSSAKGSAAAASPRT